MTIVMRDARGFVWHVPQLMPFARAFWRCALRPALALAIPLYALAMLVSGAPVSVLVRAVSDNPIGVPALAAFWVLGGVRVCAPLFGASQTEYLRSLPVSDPMVLGALLVGMVCIDAPWIWLCAATSDPGIAVAGPALTIAGHAVLASRRRAHLIALACIMGAACVVPPWWMVLLALWVAWSALQWAWKSSPAPRVGGRQCRHAAVPWIGIARALMTCVVRLDAELMRRSLAVLAAMTAVAALVLRNNRLETTEPILVACLVVLALGVPMLLSRVAARVIEVGWTLRWLYDATGVRPLDRSLGGIATALACGGTLGFLHGVTVAMWSHPHLAWVLAPAEATAGAAIAVTMLGVAAASATARGIDPLRLIVGIVATTVSAAFIVAAGLWHCVVFGVPAVLFAALVYHLRCVRSNPC